MHIVATQTSERSAMLPLDVAKKLHTAVFVLCYTTILQKSSVEFYPHLRWTNTQTSSDDVQRLVSRQKDV